VRNEIESFHLFGDVIDRVPRLSHMTAYARQTVRDRLFEHKAYIAEHGEDLPALRNWRWPY